MYPWLIFLHVLSAFAFFLAHGATATVMFRLRSERDPARLMALLDLSPAVGGLMSINLLLILVTGIVGGFWGGWWGRGWIWAALVLLIAISFVMSFGGRLYFDRVRRALGQATPDEKRKQTAPPAAISPDELAAVLNAGQPMLLAVVGLAGLAVITWLMMFKPF
jgi:hypothetical protein